MSPLLGVLKRKIKTKEQRQAELEAQIRKKQVICYAIYLFFLAKCGKTDTILCSGVSIIRTVNH